ncbi:MAG TPA: CvpA family protein [Clostridia bacterium]|nr:CvpA family protein [Clostridia bacterium]
MNWVDYAIIAILAFGFISGLRRGFVRSISSIICLLASIMVAKTYYKTVTAFMVENTSIEETITGFLSEKAFVKNMLLAPAGESAVFSISSSFTSDLNSFVTVLIINAISMLIIFLAVRFILGIAEGFLISAVKMPGLREVNSIGGAIIGLAKNVIVIMLIFTIITPISALKSLSVIGSGIEASTLAKYFYNYNFILGWIWSAALDFLKK